MAASALAVWFWTCTTTPLAGQQIRGTVVEAISGALMTDVAVSVFANRDSVIIRVVTDSIGRFSSMLRRAGVYSLRVEKIGYRTQHTDTFEIGPSEVVAMRISVGVDAVPLAPIEVTARYRVSRAHPDFEQRVESGRQSGFGHFITRDEIDATAFVRTSSMLMRVPSIRLVHGRDGIVYLGVPERGTYNCRSAVFLNGVEMSQAFGLDELGLDEIEGIEVYRSQIEIPTELARPGVCSAVAFWTRVGIPSQTWSWRPVVAGAAALTGLLLYGFLR